MIHIGTSGWSYEHWKKVFYPAGLAATKQLSYYAQYFSVVEINSTFYRIPSEKAVLNWKKQTPPSFIFALKANNYITHIKRLKENSFRFMQVVSLLEEKLGPLLFQLPPSFKKNRERLEEFLSKLPEKHLYVFEFRHDSWYTDEIYDLLKHYQTALCITDLNGNLSPLEITAPFTYIRLHGPKQSYTGSYSSQQLRRWASHLVEWKRQKISSYCFFDNDEKAFAIKNANSIIKILMQQNK